MLLKRENFFEYQKLAYAFAKQKKCCALWLDAGLGKTAPTLTLASDLLADWSVTKVLVISTKRVAKFTWPDEVHEWEHLQHLRVIDCTGGVKRATSQLEKDGDIYTINVENLPWLVDFYKKKWPFDMVIIDESTKFKSPSAKRFIAMRRVVKAGLIDYMIQLTGTPAPNGLLDVWSPMFLIDKGEALGTTYTGYQRTYFDKDYMGYNYEIKAGAEKRIYERLSDKVLVIKGSNTEPPHMSTVPVYLDSKAEAQYREMQKHMVIELMRDGETDEVIAVNKAVLQSKLQQLASGEIYIVDEDTEEKTVHHLHSAKLEALESLVEEAAGTPLLVAYAFKHERDAILKKFKGARELDDDPNIVRDWNNGRIPMLVGHPASMGHGLNLQKGSHIAVWYGLSWSLELYQQFNKRLDRTGQKNRVIIHHLVCKNSVDENIMKALARKDATQSALTDAVMELANDLLAEMGLAA